MKKVLTILSVIIGLGVVGYLGNIVLMTVGGSIGKQIINAVPDDTHDFTQEQEIMLTQLEGTWIQDTDTEKMQPMTITVTKEDLTFSQNTQKKLVFPAKHVEINQQQITLYNLGQKPTMELVLIDQDTLLIPDLYATTDNQSKEPVQWKRLAQ